MGACHKLAMWLLLFSVCPKVQCMRRSLSWVRLQNHCDVLTHDSHFVEGSVRLVIAVPRGVVTQANGGERDEAIIEGVYVVPLWFQVREDGCRHQEEQHHDQQLHNKTKQEKTWLRFLTASWHATVACRSGFSQVFPSL